MKKVIFYSNHRFRQCFKHKNEEFNRISNFRGNVPKIDRTGTINPLGFDLKIIHPIPKFDPGFSKSFSEICHERAKELIELSEKTGKRITFLWSGGVDSTAALCHMLEAGVEKLRDNFLVVLTKESIFDFPEFYESHIKDKLRHEITKNFREIGEIMNGCGYYNKNCINVSGDTAEELFGGSGLTEKVGEVTGGEYIMQPVENLPGTDMYSKDVLDFHSIAKKTYHLAPGPIETVFDVTGWGVFCFCFQYAFLRLPESFLENLSGGDDYNFPFYASEDFQQWSMTNFKKIIRSDYTTDVKNKQRIKDEVYYFTKDYEPLKDKYRYTNVPVRYYHPMDFLTINEDGVRINSKKFFPKELAKELEAFDEKELRGFFTEYDAEYNRLGE